MALTPGAAEPPEAGGPPDALPDGPWPPRLGRAVALTRAGLWAERLARAFWPLWTILALAAAGLATGVQDRLPLEALWAAAVGLSLGAGGALVWGLSRFRAPSRAEVLERLDATMPGRPLAALADAQAVGASDPASRAVWEAHRARMAVRAADARAPAPDLRLAVRDPYGLRYMALVLLMAALLFGPAWRIIEAPGFGGGPGDAALAQGPAWEGWIAPPAYTGKPQLYLADLPPGRIEIPTGSRVTIRLYGEVGALAVEETVSGRRGTAEEAAAAASAPEQSWEVTRAGRLAIEGPGGAAWEVVLRRDRPPSVRLDGEVEIDAMGEWARPFAVSDDYGVVAGTATIALDLAAVERRHGLAPAPDPREPLVLDLPMPFGADRAEFTERLVENLSEHPWANLPVTLTLTVTDAAGQAGSTAPAAMLLPGRRFFQPVARAVIEQRRDILWSSANLPRAERLLRAIAHRPEELFPDRGIYLRLSFTLRRMSQMDPATMTEAEREEIAAALWGLAVQLEDGTLRDARERLARAQERLEEAMRNGASPEEIQQLMDELRAATDHYLRMLAESAPPGAGGADEPQSAQGQGREITQDQLGALMDRIQALMEQGRMAEAQALMQELSELMQNLRVTQGEGGEGGPRQPGRQSMQQLQESLREQQELSDEAFRDLQEGFRPGQSGPEGQDGPTGRQAQRPGETGPGAGEGEGDGEEGRSLADRQEALRGEIARQRAELPGLTGEAAEAARRALERAEAAMDGAAEELREGDLADAIGRQAEAMDELREGLRNLGEAMAENGRLGDPQDFAGRGEEGGQPVPGRRDPLGREMGDGGAIGIDRSLAQGEAADRRAEELLAEIRRRAAERERPEDELDYLGRLLDRF